MSLTVWVLVGFVTVRAEGGTFVIDNIASQAACESLKLQVEKQIKDFRSDDILQPVRHQTFQCYQVEKTAVPR